MLSDSARRKKCFCNGQVAFSNVLQKLGLPMNKRATKYGSFTLSGRFTDKKRGFMKKSDQNMATTRPYTERILTSLAPFKS